MKALLKKSSDWEFRDEVEVETIEDILNIYHKVVLEKPDEYDKQEFPGCEVTIEIYDYWRE